MVGLENSMMPTRPSKKFDEMSIYLYTILALERQTDGRKDYSNIALYMHCVLTCDKKINHK